ncbi:hypothetical protein KUCAC02_030945 [Chaenocephalus aceratus]|uniref:Uncharacterized protein n=1 Tax=Chaenocephalus aceratus TaxID=36190 RepID=A0ACB9XKF1_CHAAC|nr:hypothetical protein KUCAC02_030945 [Chaenocephalus aceratus]
MDGCLPGETPWEARPTPPRALQLTNGYSILGEEDFPPPPVIGLNPRPVFPCRRRLHSARLRPDLRYTMLTVALGGTPPSRVQAPCSSPLDPLQQTPGSRPPSRQHRKGLELQKQEWENKRFENNASQKTEQPNNQPKTHFPPRDPSLPQRPRVNNKEYAGLTKEQRQALRVRQQEWDAKFGQKKPAQTHTDPL